MRSVKMCNIFSELCFNTDHIFLMDSGDIYIEFNHKLLTQSINDKTLVALLIGKMIDVLYLLITYENEEINYKLYYIKNKQEYIDLIDDFDNKEKNIILGILVKYFIDNGLRSTKAKSWIKITVLITAGKFFY